MKKLLKIFAFLMIAGGIFVGVIFYATMGVVKAADTFVEAARGADINKLKPLLSSEFIASTSDEALLEFLKAQGLDDGRSASWSSRSVENNATGEVEGEVTLGSGSKVRIKIHFVKENDEWKVQRIDPA